MPRRRLHTIPLCFALLALAWAQVFGLVRGYVCDCGGKVAITVAEHCHGPHGVACHDQAASHDEHADLPAGDTTQHHDLLKETVQANQKTQSLAAPLPSITWVVELPDWVASALSFDVAFIPAVSWNNGGSNLQRWPQVLTHTIALRI